MTITAAIIVGLIISIFIIYITLNFDKIKPKKKYKHQDLIDKIHTHIAKVNGGTMESLSFENSLEAQKIKKDYLYKNADFINKNCTSLDDFIISEEVNEFDLRKLADLNQIKLQISKGWYPLTLELIKELNENGWNKKVTCIKEKYARLEFYTSFEYGSLNHKIISNYGKKSEYICETCGKRGEIRHNLGWDYVACRKHYLENRGKIIVENAGFHLNGTTYLWKDIKDVRFEDLDFNQRYKFMTLEFKKDKIKHAGWTDSKLYVSKNTIGFGNFIGNLPKHFPSVHLEYIKQFGTPEFCEICGYLAVYNGICECCENYTWEVYQKRNNDEDEYKEEHIKYYQMRWVTDEGETYDSLQKNYPKNPNYNLLFTEDELREHLEYEDENDD